MTTAADWVSEAEQHLGVQYRSRNTLNGALDASQTTLTFNYDLGAIAQGVTITVDLERCYVLATNETAKTATVIRGDSGSTAATHADGAVVYVNAAPLDKFAIFRALNQELQAFTSAGLYYMRTVELTYNSAAAAYDLTSVTNVEGIYDVQAKTPGLARDWEPVGWRFNRNQETDDFASGFGLIVDGGYPGFQVRVQYKSRFTALTDLSTNVAATNLMVSANDLPALGAAARLAIPTEIARNETISQPDSRRASEVPAGSKARAGSFVLQMRNQRLREEITALSRQYPTLANRYPR